MPRRTGHRDAAVTGKFMKSREIVKRAKSSKGRLGYHFFNTKSRMFQAFSELMTHWQ